MKILIVSAIISLLFTLGLYGQAENNSVTINVVGGPPIIGKLISANKDVVVLDIGSGEATIKNEKIISIIFRKDELTVNVQGKTAEKTVEKTVDTKIETGQKIISALRKLDNAVNVGVVFQNYSAMLIEAKTTIDENLNASPEGTFREEAYACLLDHQYALSVWNLAVANGWAYFFSKQEPGRTLITQYGVPIKISVWTNVPVDTGRKHVWLSAGRHFNLAVNELRKLEGKNPDLETRTEGAKDH